MTNRVFCSCAAYSNLTVSVQALLSLQLDIFSSKFRVQVVATSMPATGECTQNTPPDATACAHFSRACTHTFTDAPELAQDLRVCPPKSHLIFDVMSLLGVSDFDFSSLCSSQPISSPTTTTMPIGIRSNLCVGPYGRTSNTIPKKSVIMFGRHGRLGHVTFAAQAHACATPCAFLPTALYSFPWHPCCSTLCWHE